MEFEVSYSLDTAEQFWDELDEILTAPCESHEAIDNTLRSYLAFTTNFKEEYLQSDYDVARCSFRLIESKVFSEHQEYVRRQFIYCLLQEDDAPVLHIIAAILLHDGRTHDTTLEMMQHEGAFPRLIELIQGWGEDIGLHRTLLDLLYAMSRMQRLTWDDLASIDDKFILYLFSIIESASSDVSDPYHYPIIRVLLVLNEQYMVSSALHPSSPRPLTNRVLKTLSNNISEYKTFGENLILLLNRESETSLQLLILKLLYLVFSTKNTAEYFYTNDLHVLLDVILRNLLDLPADNETPANEVYATGDAAGDEHSTSGAMQALRHTYLRVLFPLLANSQLCRPGMSYKIPEVRQVLQVLSGGSSSSQHFAPADETTVRLVDRCRGVAWLRSPEDDPESGDSSPTRTRGSGEGYTEVARRSLGMSVENGGESVLSVLAVAAHTEKPGVITPSRGLGGAENVNGVR